MEQIIPSSSVEPERKTQQEPVLIWFVCLVLGAIIVCVVTAHAPGRIKLLGLFPFLVGAVFGRSMTSVARSLEITFVSWMKLVVVVVAVSIFAGSTVMSFRLSEAARGLPPKVASLIEQMNKSQPGAASSSDTYTIHLASFSTYLARRVQQLGTWSRPWPEILWGIEWGLAGLGGYFGFATVTFKPREVSP